MKYAVFGLLIALFSSQSFAAVGTLMTCSTSRQNGQPVFVGKYDVDGRQVLRVFLRSQVRYCPTQLDGL